jgi:hypothetical protein
MATRERLIVDAMIDALMDAQVDGVDDRVYEDRGFAIAAADLPAIDVRIERDEVEVLDFAENQLGHILTVEIGVLARDEVGRSAMAVMDPIIAQSHAAIMQSETLRALVRSVSPGSTFVQRQDGGDGVVARRTMTFVIDHVTSVDDLEAAP